ncbi:MAG: thiamine phosphate synthase, partial [Methanobrevibacter sp.]|nr:thiamine phosphate synthase [Methanobrevibacter sp.]
MRKEDIDYSVYLVTDRRNKTDEEFLNIIEEAIKGGTTIVQLREKTASTKDFYQLALKVKEITS